MKNTPRDMNVDELIIHHEAAFTRGQFRAACRRLEEKLDELIEVDGCQAGRALIEKIFLISGDRGVKAIEIGRDRRGS